jgi:hypothetical protein
METMWKKLNVFIPSLSSSQVCISLQDYYFFLKTYIPNKKMPVHGMTEAALSIISVVHMRILL